jgi:hypothetical protein
MKDKGVTYDVGTEYTPNCFSRVNFNAVTVDADMRAIKNDLHCNAVRIFGKDIGRLMMASTAALENGLNIWLSPRLINGAIEETYAHIKEAASQFQLLKQKFQNREMVFIIGGEMTIDTRGFIKGDTIHERIKYLAKPSFFIKNALGIKPSFQKSFTEFLRKSAAIAKKEFSGKVTYASGMWENVDWSIFDILSVNLYKASFNKSFFDAKLKKLVSSKMPVAITEFGCCAFEGADQMGPTGYFVVDYTTTPPSFRQKCVRSENVQAKYILDLLNKYKAAGVASTFVFDFYCEGFIHNSNPDLDFDMASFGITKHADQREWEPKMAFAEIGNFYANN